MNGFGKGALPAVIALAAIALAMAGCGGGGEKTPSATSTPAAAAEPTATQPAAGEPSPTTAAGAQFSLPESPIEAALTSPYAYNDAGSLTPVAEQYPFPAGSVTARWYQSQGLYVVYFDGFPAAAALCPGASIYINTGFQNAANSPTAAGACDDADTLKPPPTGVYLCGDDHLLLFLTEVPTSSVGVLYASTNIFYDDGSATGLLGSVQSDIAQTPEVDLSSCTPPTG